MALNPSSSAIAVFNPQTAMAKEKEESVRKTFRNLEHYPHANTRATTNAQSISFYREEFEIPMEYVMKAPSAEERMYWRPNTPSVAVVTQILRNGVRFPLHPFITDFLDFVGIGLAQLVPNAYIHLVCFIAACTEFGITPALDFFFHIFSVSKTKEHGFRALNRLPGQKAWMSPPSSNKGWHNNWFFISGPDTHLLQCWAEPEKPSVEPLEKNRKAEFKEFCRNIPAEPWELSLLSNKKWLHDHGRKSPNCNSMSLY